MAKVSYSNLKFENQRDWRRKRRLAKRGEPFKKWLDRQHKIDKKQIKQLSKSADYISYEDLEHEKDQELATEREVLKDQWESTQIENNVLEDLEYEDKLYGDNPWQYDYLENKPSDPIWTAPIRLKIFDMELNQLLRITRYNLLHYERERDFKVTKQLDKWIDNLVSRGICMLENRIIVNGRATLTRACLYAKSRGARLIMALRILVRIK